MCIYYICTRLMKDAFVQDINRYDEILESLIPLSKKFEIMQVLNCTLEEAEAKMLGEPETIRALHDGNVYLAPYGLSSTAPGCIHITDFEKFKQYLSTLSVENEEESGTRDQNEFRFLFRNKILIGITNELGWYGDVTDPDSDQVHYLLNLLTERPAIATLLKEKRLDQDECFDNVEIMLRMA